MNTLGFETDRTPKHSFVVFSIDNGHDPLIAAAFWAGIVHLAQPEKVVAALGSYNGMIERSYLCSREVFDEYIRGSDWVKQQESFLLVQGFVRHDLPRAYLEFQHSADYVYRYRYIGKLSSTRKQPAHGNWTYRPDMQMYWETVT